MALGEAYIDAIMAGPAQDLPKQEPKFSAWSAVPRGIGEAGLQVGATAADLWAGFKYMRDANPEQYKRMQSVGVPVEAMSSQTGDALRDRGRTLRPDAQDASTAEQVLYGFARGASKVVAGAVVGGVPGVIAAGAEEAVTQSDELRRAGVGVDARVKAGLVQGAGLALAALPAAGTTLRATAGLYLAGGPGGFMAQQAMTREILRNAGHEKLAEQYDPFDPVGLAVSALVPAPFAAYGLRANRMRAAAKAAEDFRAGPMPSEPTAVAAAVREAMPGEVVDAAHVSYRTEQRAASHLGDASTAAAHETALARAEEQIARGEAVNVVDVAPRGFTPAEREANFRAWAQDAPLIPALSGHVFKTGEPVVADAFHGTTRVFDAFSNLTLGEKTGGADARAGHFLTDNPSAADQFTWENGDKSGNIMPAYVRLLNPLVSDHVLNGSTGTAAGKIIEDAKRAGHDGVIFPRSDMLGHQGATFVAFDPKQIKSAIGNSGRFDPNSPSLTDPITELAQAVDQLRKTMQPEPVIAPTRPEAPNPQAAAPEGGATSAPARVPEAGAGAGVEAAGVTPGARAESSAAQTRVNEIQAQMPDLQVMLDGMEKPMPLADFLAAVKAETDELAADAPLMQIAAECAILNG